MSAEFRFLDGSTVEDLLLPISEQAMAAHIQVVSHLSIECIIKTAAATGENFQDPGCERALQKTRVNRVGPAARGQAVLGVGAGYKAGVACEIHLFTVPGINLHG